MTKQEQFFYDNAGYSTEPGETQEQGRLRCARELAAGEAWLNEQGWEYSIVPDEDADLSWMTDEEREQEHEVIGVVLNDEHGNHMRYSLWCIVDADANYLRTVVAELASEAMHEAQQLASVCAD